MLYEGENAGTPQENDREQQLRDDLSDAGRDALKQSRNKHKGEESEPTDSSQDAGWNADTSGGDELSSAPSGSSPSPSGTESQAAGQEIANATSGNAAGASEMGGVVTAGAMEGEGATAVGEGATAIGEGATVVGEGATAVGEGATAVGEGATVVGEGAATTGSAVAGGGTAAGAGAEAAGGAAGGPWGIIIAVAIAITKYSYGKIKDEVSGLWGKGTVEDDYNVNPFSAGVIIAGLITCLTAIMACVMLGKLIPGSNEDYQETSYSQTLSEEQVAVVERDFTEGEVNDLDSKSPLKPGATAYIYGINGEGGFRNALHDAITDMCYHWVSHLGIKVIKNSAKAIFKYHGDNGIPGFDFKKTIRLFYENEWPYALRDSATNNEFPLVGNVCAAAGCLYTEDYEPCDDKDRLYNDVNYAEILTILSQNPDFNWRNCTLESYNEYIRRDETLQNYFELKVRWIVVYKGQLTETLNVANGGPVTTTHEITCEKGPFDNEEDVLGTSESIIYKGVVCDRDSYYCRTIVKPFGLKELYEIADVTPSPKHIDSSSGGKAIAAMLNGDKYAKQRYSGYNVDFYKHTNLDLLDRSEYMERTYLRKEADMVGPDYREERNKLSTVYYDTRTDWGVYSLTGINGWDKTEEDNWVGTDHYPKGRSGPYYINPKEQYVYDEFAKKGFKEIRKEWEDEDLEERIALKLKEILDEVDSIVVRQFIAELIRIAEDDRYGYSQGNRLEEFYYDCSSLAARVLAAAGNTIFGGGTPNSDAQYAKCKNAGLLTDVLRPGSLIYYGGGTVDENHPNGIFHVSIYIGNGQIVSASNEEKGIYIRNWVDSYDGSAKNYFVDPWQSEYYEEKSGSQAIKELMEKRRKSD